MEVLVISVLGFVGFAVLFGVLLASQRKQLAARIASIEAKVATSKEAAAAVIVPDVEAPLIAAAQRFGKPPVVLRWRDKIQVRLLQDAKTIDDLQALVDLGVEVAERSGHGTAH